MTDWCCEKHRKLAENAAKEFGDTNPKHIIGEFAESTLEISAAYWTPSRELYDAYLVFCDEINVHPEAINPFITHLRSLFPFLARKQRHDTIGYIGVRLKE